MPVFPATNGGRPGVRPPAGLTREGHGPWPCVPLNSQGCSIVSIAVIFTGERGVFSQADAVIVGLAPFTARPGAGGERAAAAGYRDCVYKSLLNSYSG